MLQYFPAGIVPGSVGATSSGLGLEEDLRAMAGVAALEGPQLALVRQTSSVVERVSRNGLQKNVHVVVKNTPFALHLALAQPPRPSSAPDAPPPLSLKWLALDASLVYDSETLKPVSFVKTKPIEYKPVVNESGDQVTLNMKIKVLTSQHEDMFFRVRVVALQQKTRQPLSPPLELVSEPIKVISKPKQSKKKTQSKKRSLNDLLIEAVQRIELQQRRQHSIVDQLVKRRRTGDASDHHFPLGGPHSMLPSLGDSSSPESSGPVLPSPASSAPLVGHLPPLSFSPSAFSPSVSSLPSASPATFLSSFPPSSSPTAFSCGLAFGSVSPIRPASAPVPTPLSHSLPAHAFTREGHEDEGRDGCNEDEEGQGLPRLARSLSNEHRHLCNAAPSHGQVGEPLAFSATTTTTSSSGSVIQQVMDELELGLEQFLAVYARLPSDDRAARIRRFMRRASTKDAASVGDFLTSAISALNPLKQVKKEPADGGLSQGCACVVCPHQQELARIDQFYKDFLAIDFPLFGSS